MSVYTKLQVLLTLATSSTASPYTRKLYNDSTWEWDMPEAEGLCITVVEDGDSLELISQQAIIKGRLLLLISDQEIDVRINGVGNDPWTGKKFIYESDTTTGITSVHVSNSSGTNATISYYIGGDIV